ncbi:MAG: hypothetical protein KA149_04695 [Chitinophagales bacterium]|jgi:hypothetical protein|nr:hypothetical protein [Chitinophagales bacterium]
MKFLEYLEKAWIGAAIVSFIVVIYNLVTLRVFDNHIYFPFFCGLFCILLWFNVRGQRRFREKMTKNEKQPNNN